MKKYLILLSCLTILLDGCKEKTKQNNTDQKYEEPIQYKNPSVYQKTSNELRNELKMKELSNPLKYIKPIDVILLPQKKLVRKPSLFKHSKYVNDGYIMSGSIYNSATLAKFKDVILKISYYSKTKSYIDSKSFPFYEYYEPNTFSEFVTEKIYPPKGFETFHVEITSAKGEY